MSPPVISNDFRDTVSKIIRNEPGTALNARGEDLAVVRAEGHLHAEKLLQACWAEPQRSKFGSCHHKNPLPQSADSRPFQVFKAAVLGSVCSKTGPLDLKLG